MRSEQPAAPRLMRKGAHVVVRLSLERDDAPAHYFAESAVAAARTVVEAGIAAGGTALKVTVKDVAADDDPPDPSD